LTERRYNLEGIREDLGEINDKLIIARVALSPLDGDLKMKTEEARKILREVQEGIKEQADDITDNPREDDNPELPTVGYKFVDESEGYSQYDGNLVRPVDATDSAGDLDENQRLEELTRKKDIHLWLADLKKTMDFDSREEAEGARKLVERAGWELGTHGYQILKEQLEEDDSDS
jgi:hypothetical protein